MITSTKIHVWFRERLFVRVQQLLVSSLIDRSHTAFLCWLKRLEPRYGCGANLSGSYITLNLTVLHPHHILLSVLSYVTRNSSQEEHLFNMDTTPLNPGDSAPSGTQQEPETQVYAQPDKILPEDELYEVRLLTNFLYWTNSLDSEAGVTNEVEAEDGNKIASDILTAWSHSFVRKDELVALTIKDTEEIRVCYEEYNDYPDSDPEDEDDSDDNDIDDVEEDVDPQDNDGEAASFRGKDARIIASNNVRETDRFDQMISRLLYPPLEIKILPSTTKISNEPSMTKWLLSRTTDRLNSDHPKTNIEFQEHIGNVMTLIKNTHQCEGEDRPRAHLRWQGPYTGRKCRKNRR